MGPAFFILSSGRSGSTLLASMLNMHPQVHVPVELFGLYSALPRALAWYGDLRRDYNRRLLARDLSYLGQLAEFGVRFDVEGFIGRLERSGTGLAAVVSCFYETLRVDAGKPLLGDKTPNHTPQLPLIEQLFPAMRVVHLVRDGRDCAASSQRARRGINQRNVYELARLWPRNNTAIAAFGARHPGRYHRLHYEELIGDPAGSLARLCGFLDLSFDPAMLEFPSGEFARRNATLLDQHANLARGVLVDNRGKWRSTLGEREVRLYEFMAGDALRRFGYSLSTPAHDEPALRLVGQAATGYRRLRRGLRAARIESTRWLAIVAKRFAHRRPSAA